MDKVIATIDTRVDQTMAPVYTFFKKYFTLLSVSFLSLLVLTFFIRVYTSKPQYLASVIKEDLLVINQALAKIDKECNILTIRSDSAIIDFLTVQKFVGSTVGCLNLAYPENWKGPYIQLTPTYQTKPYALVKARDGFFIVPGNGVKMPNGLTIGKDIIINETMDVSPLLLQKGALNFKGSQLALKITFKIGDWDTRKLNPETISKINAFLNEFNAAMPYAYNDSDNEIFIPLRQFTA